mgnify:CR=1 FL=1
MKKQEKVPYQAVMLYSRALDEKDHGNKDKAITLFKQAISAFPDYEAPKAELKAAVKGILPPEPAAKKRRAAAKSEKPAKPDSKQDAKAKSKKENLAALGLPALWERFKEATGETTKSPNKKFLVRRIEEALAAGAVEPAPAEEPQRPTRTSARATPVPDPETTLTESTPP